MQDKFMFCVDNSRNENMGDQISTSSHTSLLGVVKSWVGYSMSTAGDFNADGLSDVLIGAPLWNSNQGKAFAVFGKSKESSNHTLVPEQPEFQHCN